MNSQNANITIRALGAPDAKSYRELRLTALATSPEAFGSSYEEEACLSMDSFRAHGVSDGPNVIFGTFADGQLVRKARYMAQVRLKKRNKCPPWAAIRTPE